MFRKLLAKFTLWSNDYCTKHMTQKQFCDFTSFSWCTQCRAEEDEATKNSIRNAMATLQEGK